MPSPPPELPPTDATPADAFHTVWNTWGHLEARDVIVYLSTGSSATGHLLAVDPESGSAVVLCARSGELVVALGHAIARVDALPEREGRDALLEKRAAELSGLVLSGGDGAEGAPQAGGAAKAALDPLALVDTFRQMRVEAVAEEDDRGSVTAVCVMGGVAKVRFPFRLEDCESTNETVLYRLQGIVQQHMRTTRRSS